MPGLEDQGELFPEIAAAPAAPADAGPADTGTTQDVSGAAAPEPQSSSGQDKPEAEGPKSLEEAVTAALKAGAEKPDTDEEAGAKPAETDEGKAKAAKPDANADPDKSTGTVDDGSDAEELPDPTDDELTGLKPKVQKRVKQLLAQRNDARREVEGLRSDADNYRQVRNFMTQADLQDSEVAELFQIGADLKSGDPTRLVKFLDRVMPTISAVMEATGRVVPRDLRERVETGELSADAAKQLGQERFGRQAAEAKVKRVDQQVQTQAKEQTTGVIRDAVGVWQQQVRASDPDFDLKAAALARVAQALVAERGLPDTPEKALQYAKDAYAEVNAMMSRARPAPKPTQPAPAPGSAANRTGLSAPANSLEDIIKGAIAAGNRR